MGGIRNEDEQVKPENIIPWIDDLEIGDVFEDEDKEEGVGVMDLINGLVEMLRLEAEEQWDVVWQVFAPVEPWDKR